MDSLLWKRLARPIRLCYQTGSLLVQERCCKSRVSTFASPFSRGSDNPVETKPTADDVLNALKLEDEDDDEAD